MDRRRYPGLAVGMILVGLTLSACAAGARAGTAEQRQPSTIEHIAGGDRSRVLLTADAARRVGITTVTVAAAPQAKAAVAPRTKAAAAPRAKAAAAPRAKGAVAPPRSVIPLAAVLYDKDGRTWTYTEQQPLTFVPVQVSIARIDGDVATLTSGPPVGTPVVTVGGAELLGAEYGVPGEQ